MGLISTPKQPSHGMLFDDCNFRFGGLSDLEAAKFSLQTEGAHLIGGLRVSLPQND